MRIAKVIGTVTLSQWHESFQGASLRLVVPLSLAELQGDELPFDLLTGVLSTQAAASDVSNLLKRLKKA